MFFKNLFKKKNQENTEIIGDGFPFKLLDEETMKYSENNKMRIFRDENGRKYWEYLKPYEIKDNNFCVRVCTSFNNSTYGGWIVLSKEELEGILSKM